MLWFSDWAWNRKALYLVVWLEPPDLSLRMGLWYKENATTQNCIRAGGSGEHKVGISTPLIERTTIHHTGGHLQMGTRWSPFITRWMGGLTFLTD